MVLIVVWAKFLGDNSIKNLAIKRIVVIERLDSDVPDGLE